MITLSKKHNPNYVASIVELTNIQPHPTADRLVLTTVQGSVVITGLNAKVGDTYIYFPVECQISSEFLSWSNSYDDPKLNSNKEIKGFFSAPRNRVRMTKLRGIYSNGYIIPFHVLKEFVYQIYGETLNTVTEGSFDTICGDLFVNKYEPLIKQVNKPGVKTKGKIKKFNRVIPGQFAFHPDTKNLRYEIGQELQPTDYICISKKYHGSSFEVANTLVYKQLNFWQKLLIKFGGRISDKEYGLLYASRTVIKEIRTNPEANLGWYGVDIWGIVAERSFPKLDKGVRITGEVIGYTSTGKMIQPGYDYGVPQNELDFLVFKVDIVNPDGETWTLSHHQMVDYCTKKGFRIPECYYYGKAKDLFPDLDIATHWHDNFLAKLESTYLGKRELTNKNKTLPEEGVVLNICKPLGWKALKLKDLEFLGIETKQLDNEEVGVQDEEVSNV